VTEPHEAGDAELVELEPGDPRLGEALEVMRALRCNRSLAELQRLLDEGRRRGEYRVAALFDGLAEQEQVARVLRVGRKRLTD